ncbi:nose resistant to fluoxetine protein 6-like [Ylistrum balloti]|uniref:nose resistant to fluoxetine protein 6-like n=1 Tax=Ylistrum balloti TaxID=509963 RepID=UPI002905B8D3|nr:nose resistant to fluoxetine protein 6-like [Ylistrum balloti]
MTSEITENINTMIVRGRFVFFMIFLGSVTLSSSVNGGGTPDYSKAAEKLRTMANSDYIRMTKNNLITELFDSFLGASQPYLDIFKDVLYRTDDEVPREDFNISESCLNDAKQVILGLERKSHWALQMLDAMAKPPSDILSGNIFWTGGYEECLSVEGTVYVDMITNTGPQYQIKAKQCLGQLQLGKMGLYLGFCVPSRCSSEEANKLVNSAFSVFSNTSRIIGMTCPEVETTYDTKAIVSLVICSIIGLMMVIGTGYDVIVVRNENRKEKKSINPENQTTADRYESGASLNESTTLLMKTKPAVEKNAEGIFVKIILAFSVVSNGERILSTAQGEGSLTALNGMRFLSITWVIMGHCFMQDLTSARINSLPFLQTVMNRWTYQTILNALVSVDTFFTMSGLLLAYMLMKEVKKNGNINWSLFYFHRFWRLTPMYMLVMMIDSTLTKYMGGNGGPLWPREGIDTNCADTWWQNLLYINNFFKFEKMCMAWSWYLSNDMQFFVISPLLLVPLYRKKFVGLVTCGVVLFASLLTTGLLSSHHQWVISAIIPTTTPESSSTGQNQYNSLGTAMLHPPPKECIGFVNTLLSWKAFVPLSRLSYAAYLIHLIFITVIESVNQYPTYISVINQVVFFLGIVVITFMCSFVTSLAFESPMMALEKVILPRKKRN